MRGSRINAWFVGRRTIITWDDAMDCILFRKTSISALIGILAVATAVPVSGQDETANDPFSVVLIQADLTDANEALSIHDVNDDGALDQKEFERLGWPSKFSTIDLNRDGKLTQPEIALSFGSQRKEFEVEQIDRTVAERALKKNDMNRNGQIDPAEITPAWPEEPEEIDVDSNGILTLQELTRAFAFRRMVRTEIGIIGVDQGWAIKIRNRFDKNRDGGLNEDEWVRTPLPKKPEAFDEDSDDRLTLMEMATMLAKHRQELGLTAKDQMAARALILRLDRDFDGTITSAELNSLPNAEQMQQELKQYDTNGDTNVSLMEIEKLMSKRRDELGYTDADASQASRLMQRHDQNRDRVLRKNELRDDSAEGYLGKEVLPQADRNGDQAIDQDELARYLARQRS